MYRPRTYRYDVKSTDLVSFEVIEKETDLFISAEKDLTQKAHSAVLNYRRDLEGYMKREPRFYSSLEPLEAKDNAPKIVRSMIESSYKAGVGPMAAVAGAMAESVGRDLVQYSTEIIVENGGDIFIRSARPRTFGVYAGERSPFTGKLAIEVGSSLEGIGVCTSSGTISHSLSFGKADAVLIIAKSAPLADAVATAAGNAVKSPDDIEHGIEVARSVEGVRGVLILVGDKMGSWGEIKLV